MRAGFALIAALLPGSCSLAPPVIRAKIVGNAITFEAIGERRSLAVPEGAP